MKYPSKTKYAWIQTIGELHFGVLIIAFISFYSLVNFIFCMIYFFAHTLLPYSTLLDYLYFTFVTSLTIGFGDFAPQNDLGKIIVIIHSCSTAIFWGILISILSIRLFYSKNTIQFSKHILFSESNNAFTVRFLNIHRNPLINPEIRIFMTTHHVGNVIAPMIKISKYDSLPYLGKHDFSLTFPNIVSDNTTVFGQWNMAKEYDSNNSNVKSRFRILVSVTGNYGIQQFACIKKYYSTDIILGEAFRAIQYNDSDQKKWGNISYTKFPNFWNDFDGII